MTLDHETFITVHNQIKSEFSYGKMSDDVWKKYVERHWEELQEHIKFFV